MSFERTPYDYEMLRNYNQPGSFNAPPWPTPRSNTDIRLQQKWCPNCNKGNVVEGFAPDSFHAAPWPTPRTNFDKALQNRWCPTCDHPMPPHPSPPHPIPPSPYGNQPRRGGTNHLMENYASVMQTPQGNVRNPYQACGNTHSSGPASMPSTWEPMQMPMGANTTCCCADPAELTCGGKCTRYSTCPQDHYCFKAIDNKDGRLPRVINEYCEEGSP